MRSPNLKYKHLRRIFANSLTAQTFLYHCKYLMHTIPSLRPTVTMAPTWNSNTENLFRTRVKGVKLGGFNSKFPQIHVSKPHLVKLEESVKNWERKLHARQVSSNNPLWSNPNMLRWVQRHSTTDNARSHGGNFTYCHRVITQHHSQVTAPIRESEGVSIVGKGGWLAEPEEGKQIQENGTQEECEGVGFLMC